MTPEHSLREPRRLWSHGAREKRGFRWWLHYGIDWCLSVEASFAGPYRAWGGSITIGGDERSLAVSVLLWPLCVYFSFEIPWSLRRRLNWQHRETGAQLSWPDFFTISIGADEWHEKERGWYRSWFLLDHILGSAVYREDPAPLVFVSHVVMPERSYACHGKLSRDSWKRRFWFRRYIMRAHVDMYPGEHVPFPGKGENSWDCGEDGIYGMTCAAENVAEAMEKIRASAMSNRERYGSGDLWRPAAKT